MYPSLVRNCFACHSCLLSLQKELFGVLRQGFDEMLQFEKRAEEEKKRVYTYEKAFERYYTFQKDSLKTP